MKSYGWVLLAILPLSNGCTREQNTMPAATAQTSIAPKLADVKPTKPDQNTLHNKWVAKCLREMESVKVGMTRADLARVFITEGGVSAPSSRQYVHRECPLFKVDVKFSTTRDEDGRAMEKSSDKIIKISPPFLQWTIAD